MRRHVLIIGIATAVTLLLLPAADALLGDCPDTGAVGRCFKKYDVDGDGRLSRSEFEQAFYAISWVERMALDEPDHYFERCDLDSDGDLTAWEIMSTECMPYCMQKARVYSALCS